MQLNQLVTFPNYFEVMSDRDHFFSGFREGFRRLVGAEQPRTARTNYDRKVKNRQPYSRTDYLQDKPHYHGHRARVREKFLKSGPTSFADYELMEMVLFAAIRRADTKPLAKRILAQYDGDFNAAISAPVSELMKIQGVGEQVVCAMKIVEAAAHRLSQSKVLGREVISSWDTLVSYCETVMAQHRIEEFRILFLDRKNILIADEAQAKGTVDQVPVYPREVVKRALELNASALILVHNHPSGDPTPSTADIEMTERIVQATQAVGIEVHDHLIVGKSDNFSFRSNGYM